MLHRIDSSAPIRCLLADNQHIGAMKAIAPRGVTMAILHRAVVDLRASNPSIYLGGAGHSVPGWTHLRYWLRTIKLSVGVSPEANSLAPPSGWEGSALIPSAGRTVWSGPSLAVPRWCPTKRLWCSCMKGHETLLVSYPSLSIQTAMAVPFRHAEFVMRRRKYGTGTFFFLIQGSGSVHIPVSSLF
jgi:hypothetical protein